MGICWYCYWGWSKPVAEIYLKALTRLNGYEGPLHFGPAHVVWEDEHWDSAEWCLKNFNQYKGDYSESDLAIVRESLEELVKLPLSVRCVEPEGYDGQNPDKYPPAPGIETVKV